MNPAQLFAYFDRISDAPDAIPRLREFILDLAVRGKLGAEAFHGLCDLRDCLRYSRRGDEFHIPVSPDARRSCAEAET